MMSSDFKITLLTVTGLTSMVCLNSVVYSCFCTLGSIINMTTPFSALGVAKPSALISKCFIKLLEMTLNDFMSSTKVHASYRKSRKICHLCPMSILNICQLLLFSLLEGIHYTGLFYQYLYFPQLTAMGLHPDRPIINWKYLNSEMHLIHLTYWKHSLAYPIPKHAQNTYSSPQ